MQAVTLSLSGFGASEPVDVYLDTVDSLLLVTSAAGSVSASVTVPAATQPGVHDITAIGRKSGDAAQMAVTVTTPWLEYGYGSAHLGVNPYENTLTTSNVSSLGVLWSGAGPGVIPPPATPLGVPERRHLQARPALFARIHAVETRQTPPKWLGMGQKPIVGCAARRK